MAQITFPTVSWSTLYLNGMERQADTIALEDERIQISSKLRGLLKKHKRNHLRGNDFPIPLPEGVP